MKACLFHDTSAALHDRRVFEIVEDAYNSQGKVLIFAESDKRAAEIDRSLWIIRQDSFIPHKIAQEYDRDINVPVAIVTAEWNPLQAAILIADGHCSVEFANGFNIIHEFVYRSSPEIQETCRIRYRAYRDANIPVEYLKTGVWKGNVPGI
ncbi:MAG: DNA polymerase III subunit chi [Acidobacteriota bacterium]|jgi:DNA polymerase IIIc chi subunit